MTVQAEVFPIGPLAQTVTFRSGIARLSGTLFRPDAPPVAAAVLHGATGVPHRYYHDFARWLAARRIACLTYDYRDFGASASGSARDSRATMVDWGLADQPAAQAALEREYPGVPLWVIGHSIGGLMLPFQPGASRVSRLITVASGPVHLSDHPGLMRLGVALLWYGPGPLATLAFGRLPGRALGLGRDVPRGVYWQWRRWCTTRGFYMQDIGRHLPAPEFGAFRGDARVVAVADDAMVPPAAVWRLMSLYPEARKRQAVLRPADHGLRAIGHTSAFHRRNAAVWPEILGQPG